MIGVSTGYKQLCETSNRPKSYVIAKYGSFDRTVKAKVKDVTGDKQPFSDFNKLFNEIKATNFNYLSCEPNRLKLGNTLYFIKDKTTPNTNENIAYWSLEMSNQNRVFSTNPTITITFTEKVKFTELVLYFQEVCKKFTVYYYNDSTLVMTRNIGNNTSLVVQTSGSTASQNVTFNKIKIEFIETQEPYRYIKLNEIDFGDYLTYSNDKILDFNIIDEISLDGSELSSNSLVLDIDNTDGEYDILNPNSKLSLLQEKQEISMFHYMYTGAKYEEVALGTFLLKNASVNEQRVKIEAYDQIYFMNDIYYGSRFYKNESVYNILLDLFYFFNFTNFDITSETNDIYLTGYIPNVSFREALRLIVEASCLLVKQTRYGKIHIFRQNTAKVKTFERNYIFKENPSKILSDFILDVKEYNYSNRTENYQIYSSELQASKDNYVITFNQAPILPDTLLKMEENDDYEIISSYASNCVIKVNKDTTIKLKATLINQNVSSFNIPSKTTKEYSLKEIDNKLITKNNSSEVYTWKTTKRNIGYDFKFPLVPYVETGDGCYYKTKFNTTNAFTITKLEFSKSILQEIEGK